MARPKSLKPGLKFTLCLPGEIGEFLESYRGDLTLSAAVAKILAERFEVDLGDRGSKAESPRRGRKRASKPRVRGPEPVRQPRVRAPDPAPEPRPEPPEDAVDPFLAKKILADELASDRWPVEVDQVEDDPFLAVKQDAVAKNLGTYFKDRPPEELDQSGKARSVAEELEARNQPVKLATYFSPTPTPDVAQPPKQQIFEVVDEIHRRNPTTDSEEVMRELESEADGSSEVTE